MKSLADTLSQAFSALEFSNLNSLSELEDLLERRYPEDGPYQPPLTAHPQTCRNAAQFSAPVGPRAGMAV